MIKFLITLLFCVSLGIFGSQSAFAHELEADGGISALLHVEPNDDPIAGQKATLKLYFSDDTGKFNTKECDCSLMILRDAHVVHRLRLTPTSSSVAEVSYEFKDAGAYDIQVTGKPTAGDNFKAFELKYELKVTPDKTKPSGSSLSAVILAGAAALLIIVSAVGLVRSRRSQSESSSS
jgi:hypothetical protein